MSGDLTAAIVLTVLLIVFLTDRPPPPKPPISYEGHVKQDSSGVTGATGAVSWIEKPDLLQTGVIAKPTLGLYQHQFRDLRLQLEMIKLYILRTGKTVHAETMVSAEIDMDQLATLMDHLPGVHPIPERYAFAVAKELDSIKNRLDAMERSLEIQ